MPASGPATRWRFTPAYRDRDWATVLTSTGDFTNVVCHEARHTISISRARYLDLWRSHNRLNSIAGPNRFPVFMEDLWQYPSRGGTDTIDVAYDCTA